VFQVYVHKIDFRVPANLPINKVLFSEQTICYKQQRAGIAADLLIIEASAGSMLIFKDAERIIFLRSIIAPAFPAALQQKAAGAFAQSGLATE
jgi:hypothetical protein